MSKVEVLVATMHQRSLSKYNEMNIQTDAVFANQADRYEYLEEKVESCNVKMISTTQRGVGANRNTALLNSSDDICLLSDDDVVYVDGYEKGVIDAFDKIDDADIIIFNVDILNKDRKRKRQVTKIGRVRIYNFMRYGTYRIAFRRESLIKKNIWFILLFGGGTCYSCGEDSLFLRDCLRKGMRIYSHPYKIADVKHDVSTWFSGYHEKYFFDRGAWLEAAFPIFKYLVAIYFMFKFRKFTKLSHMRILRLMLIGMNAFRNGVAYEEWKKESANNK